MYRSGIYSLRRGLSMRSVFGPSRLVSSSSTFGRPVRGPSMKTAGAAVTAGCLLGFALCGSLVALEDKKKLQKEESSPMASSEAPKTSEVQQEQQEPATEDSAKEGKPQAAYDPDTGEINWDCPCLGGMAQGPCGEEFKAAFSCFVYSEDEPKGIDCIEKFKGMQDCFRKYPEHYAEQIKDEEEAAKVAADMESHNDQVETIPETQQTLPEESTPMKQQEADFEPLLEEDKKEVNKDDAPVAEK